MHREPAVDPDALRAARVAAGLTQHELARRVGVAGGERISRWELGTSTPRAPMVRRLAEALGLRPGDLMAVTGESDLRRLRLSAGLSARELASRAHMSLPTLVRWESGRLVRIPGRDLLEPLAMALEVRVQEVERAVRHSRDQRAQGGKQVDHPIQDD